MTLFLLILLVALLIYVFKGIIIVQQQQEVIIERMGRYEKALRAGPNFIFPIFPDFFFIVIPTKYIHWFVCIKR